MEGFLNLPLHSATRDKQAKVVKEDRRRTSIFVCSPSQRAGDKVLVVYDDTEPNGPAPQHIQLVLKTVFTGVKL